ncbi:hypothetical protein NDQ54_15970 [Lactiplantibacillus plantarum]|uniref:hypothetical protein n=1 Tax=Lactiplantibacillus plantarum TaxID=1590 RepID=UPI00203D660C|nr:hypothetical protein [Lactiplantibacillus plantarum]MCM2587632.1 hypothetical protein [Lactiplantibacillus plantarum]MCM2599812.1 hypothetical protein [Lactiplantibacillus plantarum]MCM2603009.1 hypothetical protein [Lactiplantibacillus plantarum]MCM2610340.1 hypothetical protein [Lactiplantibacillus plantarum]MCM2613404.1 hypothetical protein [Lactiplantibacillus plantarum]
MTLTNYALKNSRLTKVDLDNNSVIWRKLVDPSKAELSFIFKKMGINEDVLTGLITNDDTRCEEISSTETPLVLLLVLLFPDISHVNLKLDNLISNVFIFILSDEIITLSNYSFSNILENVQKETAHQNNESIYVYSFKTYIISL